MKNIQTTAMDDKHMCVMHIDMPLTMGGNHSTTRLLVLFFVCSMYLHVDVHEDLGRDLGCCQRGGGKEWEEGSGGEERERFPATMAALFLHLHG